MKNVYVHLKYRIKSMTYLLLDWINLKKSNEIDIKNIKTVCLILGPYRNLTTYFSSILFLHPDCQVLNHGGRRIYGNKNIDFFSNYSTKIFENFLRFSLEICKKGERGNHGGSILFSHAFDSKMLKNIYENKKIELESKRSLKALIWKESLLNTNIIRSEGFELENLLKKEKKLKFILPIRNPLDCTFSNIKTGHSKLFRGINDYRKPSHVLEKVIDEIYWFIERKEEFPDRFYYFFDYEISENILIEVLKFLNISIDQEWLSNAQKVVVNKSNYHFNSELISFYNYLIKRKFDKYPALIEKLKYF